MNFNQFKNYIIQNSKEIESTFNLLTGDLSQFTFIRNRYPLDWIHIINHEANVVILVDIFSHDGYIHIRITDKEDGGFYVPNLSLEPEIHHSIRQIVLNMLPKEMIVEWLLNRIQHSAVMLESPDYYTENPPFFSKVPRWFIHMPKIILFELPDENIVYLKSSEMLQMDAIALNVSISDLKLVFKEYNARLKSHYKISVKE